MFVVDESGIGMGVESVLAVLAEKSVVLAEDPEELVVLAEESLVLRGSRGVSSA